MSRLADYCIEHPVFAGICFGFVFLTLAITMLTKPSDFIP